jgi:hypothetical protein
MIASLITALRNNHLEPTAGELADALWFAMQIRPFVTLETATIDITLQPEKSARSPSTPDSQPETKKSKESPLSTDTQPETRKEESSVSASDIKPQTSESRPLYPRTNRQPKSPTIRSRPFRTPAATMLPGTLSLGRALRPLMRRVASRTRYVLDEAATVQQIAEKRIWQPVLQGAPERWFDVALVIDQSASMVIWQPTIVEWRVFLERHGAFRDVRTWGMVSDAETGQVRLYAGTGVINENDYLRPLDPRELIDSTRRRLILVVSDCVSPPWYTGAVTQLLEQWGAHHPVAIVQMLPQRLWTGSALGEATGVNLQATAPGLANAQLIDDEDDFWFDDEDKPSGIKMPIVTLEPESLAFWARMLMGRRDAWIPGVIFESRAKNEDNTPPVPPNTENHPSAKQRVQHFYASPMAQRLAGYLAAAPLTLPVMRLVQQVMLPESRQIHLAEVFLGGLLKRVSPQECNPLVMEYDFHEGVRDFLLDSVLVPDAVEVLKEVSEYLEKRLGQPLDFLALLADPTAIDGIVINENNRHFAEIGAKVLRRLGGDYGQLAEKIEKHVVTIVLDH